jgi:hypothetical protein
MSAAAEAIQRFTGRYPSVEGFYILSRTGELGYIRKEDQRAVKETFPQMQDRNFLLRHPSVAADVPLFLAWLHELAKAYLESVPPGLELGYLLPGRDPTSPWKSASFVLHDHVLSTIHYDQQAIFKRTGIGNPLLATAIGERNQARRSVYRGFAELIEHHSSFGVPRYFPALFQLNEHTDGKTLQEIRERATGHEALSPLRVLNLRWQPPHFFVRGHPDIVFKALLDNLRARGAILEPPELTEEKKKA